jgi:hypothetical protein
MTMEHTPARRTGARWLARLALAGLAISACGAGGGGAEPQPPASLEEVAEGEIGRITLTERAATRLDIRTGTVETGSGGAALEVPFAAVIYQPDGTTWVYANPAELTYKREPIEIDSIDGNVAQLTSGPPAGTKVVTQGASELWGFEFGIGK